MPFPLLIPILAAVGAVALAAVVVAIVMWKDILSWFQSRNALQTSDKDHVAFTLKEKLEAGKFKVIQGIFNQRTNTLVDGQALQSKKLDTELELAHRGEELVLYR